MNKFTGRTAVILLSATMTIPSPAAFASQKTVEKLTVTENAGSRAEKVLRCEAPSQVPAFENNFSYNGNLDRERFLAKIDNMLKAIMTEAEKAEDDPDELKAKIKGLKKKIKALKKAGKELTASLSAPEQADILYRLKYASDMLEVCRRDLDLRLEAAEKAEEEKKAQEAAAAAYVHQTPAASYAETYHEAPASEEISMEPEEETAEESETEIVPQEAESAAYECSPEDETEAAAESGTKSVAEVAENQKAPADEPAETGCQEETPEETELQEQAPTGTDYQEETSTETDCQEETPAKTETESSADQTQEGGTKVASGMIWPVLNSVVTSSFGEREAPTEGASTYHRGIDIAASEGDSVSAAASGTVRESGYNDAMGNYVIIDHEDGLSTIYEHCSEVYAQEGQEVNQGDSIGAVGSTGISTGSHLHFGVESYGEYQNPEDYLY